MTSWHEMHNYAQQGDGDDWNNLPANGEGWDKPELWETVFLKGFAPNMSTGELEALLKGLREDDRRLIQGAATEPPPLLCVQDWPCEGACAIGFTSLATTGKTVADVESQFARLCKACDDAMGEPSACRSFINFFDDTPRAEMRTKLAAVVEKALAYRSDLEAAS